MELLFSESLTYCNTYTNLNISLCAAITRKQTKEHNGYGKKILLWGGYIRRQSLTSGFVDCPRTLLVFGWYIVIGMCAMIHVTVWKQRYVPKFDWCTVISKLACAFNSISLFENLHQFLFFLPSIPGTPYICPSTHLHCVSSPPSACRSAPGPFQCTATQS